MLAYSLIGDEIFRIFAILTHKAYIFFAGIQGVGTKYFYVDFNQFYYKKKLFLNDLTRPIVFIFTVNLVRDYFLMTEIIGLV